MLRIGIGLLIGLLAASPANSVKAQERLPVIRGLAECTNISLPAIRAMLAPPQGSQPSQPDVPQQKLPPPNLEEARRRIAVAQAQGLEELDLGGLSLRDVPAELFELKSLKRLHLGLDSNARTSALLTEEQT